MVIFILFWEVNGSSKNRIELRTDAWNKIYHWLYVWQLHSIFLHLRRVLKMAELQREESWFIITLWAFNWFTFFTSRMAMHIFVTLKLVLDITKFPSGVEWPLAISGMMGLNILNVILGIDLSKAFLKESNSWRKRIHKKVTWLYRNNPFIKKRLRFPKFLEAFAKFWFSFFESSYIFWT